MAEAPGAPKVHALQRTAARVFHLLGRAGTLARACSAQFLAGDGDIQAAALAFYTLLSLVPLAAVVLALAGAVMAALGGDSPAQMEHLTHDVMAGVQYLSPFLPEASLKNMLGAVINNRGNLGMLGTLSLLVAASQVVNVIRRAVMRPFGVLPAAAPDAARTLRNLVGLGWARLKTLFWISALGFLMGGVRLVLATLASLVRFRPPHSVHALLTNPVVTALMSQASGALFCFLGYNAVLLHVARKESTWRGRAVGGLVFAALQGLAEVLYSVYLDHWTLLSIYGPIAGLMAVALWTFYFSCVFLWCVELTAKLSKPPGAAPRAVTL